MAIEAQMAEDKTEHNNCLNCGASLASDASFCHHCGQKVDGNNLRIRVVIKEFFESYFSLDTQFGRSIIPFLFKPGYLTLNFNKGIRKNYANPFRLYIILSIFFFFVVTHFLVKDDEGGPIQASTELYAFTDLPEYERLSLEENVSEIIIQELNSKGGDSSFVNVFNGLSDYRKKRVTRFLSDDFQQQIGLPADSVFAHAKVNTVETSSGSDGFNISIDDINNKVIQKYGGNTSYTDQDLLDSMDVGELDYRTRFVYLQAIRMKRAGRASVNRFMINNMSFALFIFVPLTALLFFLFYYKSANYYVQHLIHSIHLHSFFLLLFGFIYLIIGATGMEVVPRSILVGICSILMIIYIIRSFMVVYQKKFWNVMLRMPFIAFFYFILFVITLVSEALISFLTY